MVYCSNATSVILGHGLTGQLPEASWL